MSRKSILLISAVVAFLVAAAAGLGVFFWVQNSKSEIIVPISVNDIKTGHAITEEDLTTVKINPNAASGAIVLNAEELVGCYSLRPMGKNEYFYRNWISPDYARRLAERMRYTAVPASTDQLRSVNGEIKEDDFVKITIITEEESAINNVNDPNTLGTSSIKLIEPPELSAVRVLGIYDGSGLDINGKRDLITNPDGSVDPNASLPQGSFIIFDCTDIQRALIIQAEHMGKIQLVLIPEADQQKERIKWGLVEDDSAKAENYSSGSIDVGIDYSEPKDGSSIKPGSEEDLASQKARESELIEMNNEARREIIEQAAKDQGVVLDDVEISNTTGVVTSEGRIPSDDEQPAQQG